MLNILILFIDYDSIFCHSINYSYKFSLHSDDLLRIRWKCAVYFTTSVSKKWWISGSTCDAITFPKQNTFCSVMVRCNMHTTSHVEHDDTRSDARNVWLCILNPGKCIAVVLLLNNTIICTLCYAYFHDHVLKTTWVSYISDILTYY